MKQRIGPQLQASRAAAELQPGQVVTLGPGLPSMVPGFVPPERRVLFHAGNGVLGYGPMTGTEDSDLVDASGHPINLRPGGVIVSCADSYGIARGGYVDVAVIEAIQVSERGDVAGPAAETMAGVKRVIAMVEHNAADGTPGIVRSCSHPVAAARCVDLIVSDVVVIQVEPEGLVLRELAPGWTVDEVRELTEATLIAAPDLKAIDYTQPEGRPASKVYDSAAEAVSDIPDGAVLLMDGFAGPGGMAQHLILALRDQGAKDLTIVSNTAGIARVASFGTPPGFRAIDHSLLVDSGQIRKAVASFPVSPSPSRPSSFELAYRRGDAELELSPQGTLAERIRAGGYGIVAFYTPTGAGTLMAEGKRTRIINGREHVLEYGIRGDFALLRALKADTMGNLVYKGTSRNFNAVMAPAAAVTIVEADQIVEPGELDPDAIVTPGIFVQRIVRRPLDFSPYDPVG